MKDDVTKIKVDNISNQPFEGTALEQHNLNHTTAQQTVNNKEVTTESEEFHDVPEDFCNVLKEQPRSITGEQEAQIHYISNPSIVGNGCY
ncbi:hypothetical protein [Wolbachia endosymbiont of Trichogramma kaykai]|uniref:hypothetical protein n=1 Tax=Wolbachia endosymbiont of Trichogramma kaykai TaxID=444066 RepID=UPI003891473F